MENELGEKQKSKLKAHLDKCSSCNQELNLLKESWGLLGEWKPINPSPNFKARFWQRVAGEEVSLVKEPVFVFPRLPPRFVPAFATLGIILVISIYLVLVNSFFGASVQRLVLLTKNEDIQMLQDLEFLEDYEIIQDINTLEDFEIINSINL